MSKENKKTIEVVVVLSPFDRTDKLSKVLTYNKQSVYEIVQNHIPTDIEGLAVSINGGEIKEDHWQDTYLLPSDQIVLIPIIGSSEQLQFVAIIALFFFAPQIAVAIGGTAAGTAVALTTFGQFLTLGVMIGGAMLIQALGPSFDSPNIGLGADADQSTFNAFNPATKQRQGLVVPRIFGKIKTYGNIIGANTELNEDNDKQILNLLIALSKGPIKGIVDFGNPSGSFGQMKINDQPIENFFDILAEHRKGTLNQAIISFFDDVSNETIRDTRVFKDNPVVFTTSNGNFDELEVKLGFPSGLFSQNDQGNLVDYSVPVRIEIAIASSGDWETLFDDDITDNRTVLTKRNYKTIDSDINIINGNNYDIRVSRDSFESGSLRIRDILLLSSVSEVLTDDFIYPLIAIAGIKALASDQLSGSLKFSAITEGSICRVWNGTFWENKYSDNPSWVLYNVLSSPIFSGEEEGNYVVDRYDGVNPDQIDTEAFFIFANYCDDQVPISEDDLELTERRHVFNGGWDTETSVWQAALDVCKLARCALVFNGTTISVVIDRPTDVSQMFGMGNIIQGSFKENFPPMSERASEIEINFMNAETDYSKNTFTIFNTSIPNNSNKTNIDLLGCTSESQAWRHGDYILRMNQFLLKTIEFQTSIDSIACQVGDVIQFAHDVPSWNQSGRTITATSTTLTMSEDFIDENPSASDLPYKIQIRLQDDTIQENDILSFDGPVIVVTAPFNVIPSTDDIYQIGTTVDIVNEFRVTEISRTSEQNALIRAIDYNEEIYNGDLLGAQLPTDSAFNVDVDNQLVTDLRLGENVFITASGIIQRNIDVSYDLPDIGSFLRVQIFVRIQGIGNWDLAGTSTNDVFQIFGVLENTTYEIKVITQLNDGRTSTFDNSPAGFITTGTNEDFEDQLLTVVITGLQIEGGSTSEWEGEDVALIWDAVPIEDDPSPAVPLNPSLEYWEGPIQANFIADYEVKIYNFQGNRRRTVFTQEARYTYTYETNAEDGGGTAGRDLSIEVKVRDKFGRVADVPAVLERIQNPKPAAVGNLVMNDIPSGYSIEWDPVIDTDLVGYKVWASQVSPVDTSDDDDLVYKGPNTRAEIYPSTINVTWYAKVASYDKFTETDLNISGEVNAFPESPAGTNFNVPFTNGIFWSDSHTNPSVDRLSWTAGTVTFASTTYAVAEGETNETYVYWVEGEIDFRTTNIATEAVGEVDDLHWVMATNEFGRLAYANGQGNKIIHGGLIQASTITADGAQIAAATIGTAQIQNLAVDTGKITDLSVETLKIGDNAVSTVNSAYTAGTIGIGTNTTVQSFAFTVAAEPVFILGAVKLNAGATAVDWSVNLRRDSTTIWSAGPFDGTFVGQFMIPIQITDDPGSGTYTYAIRVSKVSSSGVTASNRSLYVQELLK